MHRLHIKVSMGGNFVYFGQIFNKFTQSFRYFCILLREYIYSFFFIKTVSVNCQVTALW